MQPNLSAKVTIGPLRRAISFFLISLLFFTSFIPALALAIPISLPLIPTENLGAPPICTALKMR